MMGRPADGGNPDPTQPESVQTDAPIWRGLMGIGKADTIEDVAKKVEQGVEIVSDHEVIIRTQIAAPELKENRE